MKTKKWLKVTLAVIAALVLLAGAGFAGYRIGLAQNAGVAQQLAELRAQREEQFKQSQESGQAPRQNDKGFDPHTQDVDPRSQNNRGFEQRFDRRGGGRDGFFPLLFDLVQLLILAGIFWIIYKLAKSSGWKLVRDTPQPAPPVVESAAAEEEKDEE